MPNTKPKHLDESLSFEERASSLVESMTLDERISQMAYYSTAIPRLGVNEYNWWNECLHGVGRNGTATMFPQPIGMAAAFDPDALFRAATIISDEARIKHHAAEEFDDRGIYKGLTMWSPNINIFRDPRWGRGHETYGEDPFLTSLLGEAFIKGLQGDDPKYYKVIATAKHFAVHSGPEATRHEFDVKPSKRDLRETYFPAFEHAVKNAKVHSVMGAYNRVYGESASGSNFLLGDVLRDEWGFDGYVVSDCGAVEDIWERHKIVGTPEEAAAVAVNAGCDLCCGMIYSHLVKAARDGLISEETITRAAYRLVLAKMKLGMFDDMTGHKYASMPYEKLDCKEHHDASLELARDSVVLLKNNGTLPLDKNIKTVAVIGPNADSRAALYGNYCGTPSESYTILEGLRRVAPNTRFIYAQGSMMAGEPAESSWGERQTFRIAEALKAASVADAVILVTGLTGEAEGEEGYGSGDRETMNLPAPQITLIEALATVNVPKIWVNMTGSATLFPCAEKYDALLQAWYPGQMGGIAVADILFGNVSPSGKLPITFYADMAQVPDFSDYSMNGRTYKYLAKNPAYPFGYGLSYARFEYHNVAACSTLEGVRVTFELRNVSSNDAKETAQVYAEYSRGDAPIRKLVAFQKMRVKAGEVVRAIIDVPRDRLDLVDENGFRVAFSGDICLSVGGGQATERQQELTGQRVERVHAYM